MSTYANKIHKDKSQSVSNGKSPIQSSRGSVFQFVDNRPEALAQRKLQEKANRKDTVVQLYPVGGVPGSFVSASGRPNGHSNVATKDAIIDDIFSRAPRNSFETTLGAMSIGSAKTALRGTWLSANNCAICHKEPISQIERVIVEAANSAPLSVGATPFFLGWISTFFSPDPLGLAGSAMTIAGKVATNTATAAEISQLILLIDRSPTNLFVGDSPTNSGIGAAFDHNLDVSDPTDTAPAPASPRANAIYTADHNFAPLVGETPSSPSRDTDSAGDKWVRSSGASGWVHSNE